MGNGRASSPPGGMATVPQIRPFTVHLILLVLSLYTHMLALSCMLNVPLLDGF